MIQRRTPAMIPSTELGGRIGYGTYRGRHGFSLGWALPNPTLVGGAPGGRPVDERERKDGVFQKELCG